MTDDTSDRQLLELVFEVFGRRQEPGEPPLESLLPSLRLIPDAPLTPEENAAVFLADCRFRGFKVVQLDHQSYHSGHCFVPGAAISEQNIYATKLKALEAAEQGGGWINVVPIVLDGLSPRRAREFLLQALQHSDAAAMVVVYAAAMAVHGCPLGDATAAQLSYGYLMRVRRAVTEDIGLEILEAARHHRSAAVRKSVKTYCDNWIQAARRNSWPPQYPRWPEPNCNE